MFKMKTYYDYLISYTLNQMKIEDEMYIEYLRQEEEEKNTEWKSLIENEFGDRRPFPNGVTFDDDGHWIEGGESTEYGL